MNVARKFQTEQVQLETTSAVTDAKVRLKVAADAARNIR